MGLAHPSYYCLLHFLPSPAIMLDYSIASVTSCSNRPPFPGSWAWAGEPQPLQVSFVVRVHGRSAFLFEPAPPPVVRMTVGKRQVASQCMADRGQIAPLTTPIPLGR